MTTMEQIELVEAWAWLRAGGGLVEWDEHFGGQRSDMEILYFGYMRWKYTHVKPRLFSYALWAAWMFQGEQPTRILVETAKKEVGKKFTRKPPADTQVNHYWVDKVVENMPPMFPPFDDARRLTKAFRGIIADDWSEAAWFKRNGYPLCPADIKDIRPGLTSYYINKKIKQAEEQAHV